MNRRPEDSAPEDNGVLDDGVSIDTTGIGILGPATAHVEIVLPALHEDDEIVDAAQSEESDAAAVAELVVVEAAAETDRPAPPDAASKSGDAAARAVVPEQAIEGGAVAVRTPRPKSAARAASAQRANAPAVTPAAATAITTREGDAVPTPERPATGENTLTETPAAVRIGDLADGAERETPDLLTADRLLDTSRLARPEPEGAWSSFVYAATGGRLNLGDGKRARARKELDRRIGQALPGGARFVAVLSRKGGVGKTTVTALLGMALASVREDRVIAVDANPDRGTLADRIDRRSGKTVRDLVREREVLRGYNDISAIVSRDETRLDVLASDTGPNVVDEFSAGEYDAVADVARHYYSIVLTDTGTGIVHSVMGSALGAADALVIVAGSSIDEARLASETLTWLEANGYEQLARRAVVVLDTAAPGQLPVRQDEVVAHFRTRVANVVRIPYDPKLAAGGPIVFRELAAPTREAARELAVTVVEGLRAQEN